jgi:hypothetical protein
MLKSFKDIPNPYDFDVRPSRTKTCSKRGDQVARGAMPQCNKKAKLLNRRAIRPYDLAAYAIPLVELHLDETAICARIGRLESLIFLRLQDGGAGHAQEGCGDKDAGRDKSEKGESFRHLVLLSPQPAATSDVTTSAAETPCYFTHTKCFDTAKVPARRVLFCALR